MGPLENLTADDESRGDAGPKVEIYATGNAGERAPGELGKRGQLHVVAERGRQRGKRLAYRRGNREACPARDVGREIDTVDAGQPHRGHADGAHVTAARPLLTEHLVRERERRLEHALGTTLGLGRQRPPTTQFATGIADRRSDLRAANVECDDGARCPIGHLSGGRA